MDNSLGGSHNSNAFNYVFDPEAEEWRGVQSRLRRFYAPHMARLYLLFDELGVEFPEIEGWPRWTELVEEE